MFELIAEARPQPLRIRDRLAGCHMLITGSTGFLAKAFVEKLLRSTPDIGGLHLLIRQKSGGTAIRRRLMQEVLGTRAFDRLRAAMGPEFHRLCEERVHVVNGDLTRERLGLDSAEYEALTRKINLVVNSAATVTFDEQIDLAVELNTLGPRRLLQFAQDCGNVPFMHVSTCYVCGRRTGSVVEDFSAPEIAREKLPRIKGTGAYDLDRIVSDLREESRRIIEKHGAGTEPTRQHLIDAGMRISREFGWNDTYTFTKWVGEQVLLRDHDKVPLVIFRPAIIEGSFDEPAPGWIDGLRMADPIIVAYGKGKLREFPADARIPIDFIPVDFVANAMVATLPIGSPQGRSARVYQCASSDRNPLMLERMRGALIRAFRKRPMNDDNGHAIHPGPLRIISRDAFLARVDKKRRWLLRYRSLLERMNAAGRRIRRLTALLRQLDQLTYFAQIYSPYTHLDCRFVTDELDKARDHLHPDDQVEFPFDVLRIDWDDYIINRHVPGLRSFVLGTGGEPSRRIRGGQDIHGPGEYFSHSLQGASLFEVVRRTADTCPDKPALQVRRQNRWIRYTYEELVRATGAVARRLTERGLSPGDRVAICGENCPEWGVTYLAVMRAGMTAVPLDPQLPAKDAWHCVRFAEAKLLCSTPNTLKTLSSFRDASDCELVVMREPFVPPPGASRDDHSEPFPVDSSSVASILFTSGTTVAPKAVQLTHRNFISNALAMLQIHAAHPTDEFLSVLPMYHAFEFTGGFFVPLACGATITYVEQLKGPELTAAMQMTGTTAMLVVPRLLKMFIDSIESRIASSGRLKRSAFRMLRFLSAMTGHRFARNFFGSVHKAFGGHLRILMCGGSRLEPDLLLSFRKLGFNLYEGYGLTETSPVLALTPPGKVRPGCVGPPLPNVDIEIRNATNDGIGEVWARGPSIMVGYLKNEEATREVLVDGWFRTGDLGRIDAAGFVQLTGRSKDLIVSGAGKNVYPDEVEARYAELPFVKELCVFGMPGSDGLGDIVHAVAVIDSTAVPELDRSSIEREIRQAVADISEQLPSHQRIAALHFWDRELPKTSTLKAKRGLIRDLVLAEGTVAPSARSHEAPVDVPSKSPAVETSPATLAAVRRVLSQLSKQPERNIQPGMHLLLDLGIDSIGRIDVIGAIETMFDMEINDVTGAKITRVADILAVVGTRKPVAAAKDAPTWERRLVSKVETNGAPSELPASLLPVRWLLRGAVGGFMHTYVRVHAHGLENLPAQGPFILTPNHSSHLDTPSVLTAIGGRRRVWVAGAEDYFFNNSLKRFLFGKVLDTIAFDRHADGLVGLRRCGVALSRGDGLLLFPEGTRSTTGEIQQFRIGAAVLAIERHVPIIPVHVDKAYDLFPKGTSFPRPGVIHVTFGKPVPPPAAGPDVDHYALFQSMTRAVETSVRNMARGAAP